VLNAKISLEFLNEMWILNAITQVILEMKINIEWLDHKRKKNGNTQLTLMIKVLDYDYLLVDRLVERIQLKLGEKLLSKEVLEIKG